MAASRRKGTAIGRRRARRHGGFTLLELLIAVVLMAVLSLMCWRGLQAIIDGRDRITLAANEMRALSTAFTQLDEDLRRSWPVRLFHLPQRPIMFLPGDRDTDPLIMVLTRESVASDALQVQQVLYRVNDGVLERGFNEWSGTGYSEIRMDELIWQPLINGVEGLAFRAWVPGTGWLAGRGLLELAARPRPVPNPNARVKYDGPVGVEITLNRAGDSVRRLFAVQD